MDEWQIALVLFAHPSREKKILKRCHHCLFFLPCFIEEKKKKIEKGKKCRRDSNSISFKIDQKKDIKARKAGTSLLLSPSAFVVSWLGLHLVAVIIQQLAAVVYPGPLGLAVHDLDDAPAVEDMAAITQVVSWKLRRQNIYVIYRTNRGGRGGGGGEDEKHGETNLTSNAFLRCFCPSSVHPKSISSGNSRHVLRPSSMIGVRQYAHDTLHGVR